MWHSVAQHKAVTHSAAAAAAAAAPHVAHSRHHPELVIQAFVDLRGDNLDARELAAQRVDARRGSNQAARRQGR